MEGITERRAVCLILYGALGVFVLWLMLKFALPWLLPFILAFATAKILEPAVKYLTGRYRFKRGFASAVCCSLFLGALLALLYLAARKLFTELTELAARLPELTARAESLISGLSRFLPQSWVDAIISRGAALSGELLPIISGCASGLPDVVLFAAAYAMGLFLISGSFDVLHGSLEKFLPDGLLPGISGTFGKWLRAQLILMAITFLILAPGLLLLHADYALLLSLAIAVVDALPVLGVGTVLIPWAVYSLLMGQGSFGVGLIVLYGAVTLVRSLVQPKILGSQLGLHPLAALVAMYVGYRAAGLWGMILFPVLLLLIRQAAPYIKSLDLP